MTRDKPSARRLLMPAFACLAALALALPAAGQLDVIEPGEPKVAFDHDNVTPSPVDHNGAPVNNANPIPWFWHSGVARPNVAGVQFTLKYDPYEVNILGITPSPTGPFLGHTNIVLPQPLTVPTEGNPAGPGVLTGNVVGTLWITHSAATGSGITVPSSNPVPLLSVTYQPRHTSEVSNPQFNSEVDVRISQLRPIIHVTTGMYQHIVQFEPGGASLWEPIGGSTFGVLVPKSGTWFPGTQVTSDSAPSPIHVSGLGTVVVSSSFIANQFTFPFILPTSNSTGTFFLGPSATVHVPTGHPGVHVNASQVILASDFFVGPPVAADHLGLGIDHVPEPVTAAMIGLGTIVMVMRRRKRHRGT